MIGLGWAPLVAAAEPAPSGPTQLELEAWLSADPAEPDSALPSEEIEAPPPAPRKRGLVIEGSAGALGHVGDMQHVSPISPWFRLQLGYELFDWLMLFGAGDVALSSTTFASRPPDKRSYALFGVSAGVRLAWQPLTALGFYLQGDAGLSSVDEDVLATYGYPDADRIRPFFGGTLGIEWFQISPRHAISLYGGARDYVQNFERTNGEKPPIVWVSALAIRYTL